MFYKTLFFFRLVFLRVVFVVRRGVPRWTYQISNVSEWFSARV
jgi:hypothetical protein